MKTYITSMGKFLPGEPVDNDSMEDYLGKIGGKPSRIRPRILNQNGIQTRYYAIDKEQKTLFSNAEMAAHAVRDALARGSQEMSEVDFLAAATSQGDFPLPGFASMVHAELDIPPCEIATLHGVCASGVMALKTAMLQVLGGGKKTAVACASEFASRLLKSTRFEAQEKVKTLSLSFDTEFLRWMLSDGAGAAVLQGSPSSAGLCYEIEWIELKSFANRFEPCMYVGPAKNGERLASWLDYPSYHAAADDGAINLRQDVRMLGDVVRYAVQGLLELADKARLDPAAIDWLVAHYSSHVFRDQSYELAAQAGFDIPQRALVHESVHPGKCRDPHRSSCFSKNCSHSGKLKPGQKVLCLVPESGRFLFGYMLLQSSRGTAHRCRNRRPLACPRSEPPQLGSLGAIRWRSC